MTILRTTLMLLAALTVVSGRAYATEEAGKIIFASGASQALAADGHSRALQRGNPVFSGDTLVTGDGRIQVRFSDGAFVSLQPNARLVIAAYHYAGQQGDGKEETSLDLVKGGLRAVTGVIGVRSRETYHVETAVATIGIRGTAYSALYCNGDCPPQDGVTPQNGLYVQTGEGTIIVGNAAGTLDLTAGQSAFIPSADQPPQPRDTPPLLLQAGGGNGDTLQEPQLLMGDEVNPSTGYPRWLSVGAFIN